MQKPKAVIMANNIGVSDYLPNVHLTSHIAGSTNDEVHRMADFMIDDFERWTRREPLCYAVAPEELPKRAR